MSSKQVMDGNTAAAYASYPFTEVAAIYPITPSSQMAEEMDEWAAKGRKNLFGQTVDVIEMQSEAGAAGTCHGSLQAGALTTTYTAAQGLVLMIPPIFRIAGEYLPGVFHVAARTVAQNYWSIYGDHSDVMACRSTGIAMLCSTCPQEAMDLGTVAHLAAINGNYSFMHFFDGFRTSHELQKIDVLDMEDLRPLVDWSMVDKFRKHALNPEHPFTRGATPDTTTFFQMKEAANDRYENLPDVVQTCMDGINRITGRNYKLFNYYGAPDATEVVVAMGSLTETLQDTVEYLNKQGRKTGVLCVHLYRPFSARHFVAELPKTVKRVAVLDRTKESGAVGEPLYLDVKSVLADNRPGVLVVGGRAGISGKDTTPGMLISVYDNLLADEPKNDFTVGIIDDVYFKSLPWTEVTLDKPGEVSCKLWGTGGDGTVGANKNSLKIIGGKTDMYTQAYFAYDAKKSGGVTQSHLRFGKDPIHATYLVSSADFVGVHNVSYLEKFDVVKDLKQGGKFLLNCNWKPEEVEEKMPAAVKKALAEKNARLFIIDATDIAESIGLGNRTNSILQSAFFKLIDVIPMDVAIDAMKSAIKKTYFEKYGQKTVDMNWAAVDGGVNALHEIPVPESWKNIEVPAVKEDENRPAFIKDLFDPILKMEGDKIPVSVFKKHGTDDGTWQSGTSKYDKRADAIMVPKWDVTKCIQCNQCAYVCPHAAIRPFLLTAEEKAAAPAGFETKKAIGKGLENYEFRIQVSPFDCLGCGMCVTTCPAKEKAITLTPFDEMKDQHVFWDFVMDKVSYKEDAGSDANVKSVMFKRPYYQFPPACAGCGETEYVRLVSQLFGNRMYVANASGCTAAHGGCAPSTPYGTDEKGFGIPWEQSLFEDNAEFGFGFLNAHEAVNKELVAKVEFLKESGVCAAECEAYLENRLNGQTSRKATDDLLFALEKLAPADGEVKEAVDEIVKNAEFLAKKSVWCFGGDGWAYDIGYGGLDHVLAMNKDINMLVMDTEVYSNTGGQSSKATPTGSTAKFAAAGKTTKKKDLGMMLMSYGYIYVAQVAMGANQAQTLKAIKEAESYPGPAVVIAYAPCTAHGIPGGMANTQVEMKKAVESGYWTLYRYDPRLKEEGKNPFQLDSPAPTASYLDFIRSERRYTQLERSFPDKAKALFEKSAKEAADRYAQYAKMAAEK